MLTGSILEIYKAKNPKKYYKKYGDLTISQILARENGKEVRPILLSDLPANVNVGITAPKEVEVGFSETVPTAPAPIVCPTCGFAAKSAPGLLRHQRTHNKE